MTTGSRYLDQAKRLIEALAATHSELADGFTEAELDEIDEFARPLRSVADNSDAKFRLYLEIKQEVRKDRLILLAIIPALSSVAAMRGKKLLMLVAEDAQRWYWAEMVRCWLGRLDLEITTWAESTRRLGGFGAQHSSYWFLGDIDTGYPPASEIPLTLGNPIVEAIDRLINNRSANLLMIHQIGRLAVLPKPCAV
jgi:hypothetical protein